MSIGEYLKNRNWRMVTWQFIKFGLVGLSNAIVLYGVYYVLLKLGLHHIPSYIIAFVASVLNAYLWNDRYVFQKSEEIIIRKILKIYASYTTTFLLSLILLYVWVDCLQISDKIAPIINIVLTTPINFVLNKLWTFKDKV